MKKFNLLILCIGLVVSCQKESLEMNSIEKQSNLKNEDSSFLELVALTGDYEISLEEAKELAISAATQMRVTEGLSARIDLSISNIETITEGKKEKYDSSIKRKGELKNPDMYLFNFSNNQGYVLLSADNRASGVLAYNSSGHLGDVIDNPGELLLLERASLLINKKRQDFEAKKEKLKKRVSRSSIRIPDEECLKRYSNRNTSTTYGNWRTSYKRGPLVKTLWSQGGSYNDYIPKKCGSSEAPVGCVAVAVGQLMAYNEEPNWFKGRYMNWDKMKRRSGGNLFSSINTVTDQDAKNDIKFLLHRLGDTDLLDMDYACDGSGSSNAFRALKNTGYNKVEYTGHDANKIISEIKQYRPLYIEGCAFKEKYRTGTWPFRKTKYRYSSCHAWVLDGYVKKSRTVTKKYFDECTGEVFESTYTQHQELIHNNFGWGGSLSGNYKASTGWYNKGLYDANNRSDEASNHSFKSGESNNYQFVNKIIIKIEND